METAEETLKRVKEIVVKQYMEKYGLSSIPANDILGASTRAMDEVVFLYHSERMKIIDPTPCDHEYDFSKSVYRCTKCNHNYR